MQNFRLLLSEVTENCTENILAGSAEISSSTLVKLQKIVQDLQKILQDLQKIIQDLQKILQDLHKIVQDLQKIVQDLITR